MKTICGYVCKCALHLEETYFQSLRRLKDSRIVHRFLDCFPERLIHQAVTMLGSDHRSQAFRAVDGEGSLGGYKGEGGGTSHSSEEAPLGPDIPTMAAATKTQVAETGFESKGAP